MNEVDTRPRLLLVDHEPLNLMLLRHLLHDEFRLVFARDGERALSLARQQPPDLVLLDMGLPPSGGVEWCRRFKQQDQTAHVPVILVTSADDAPDEAAGFAAGAVDFVAKPYAAPVLRSRIHTHLLLRQTNEWRSAHHQVVQCLGLAAEYKDNESGLHVIRISHMARILGEALEWSASDVDELFSAAGLHDVGKIGVPDAILQKPAALSAEEMAVMRQHAEIGARIIGQHDHGMLAMAARIALSHHERWDGTGYPLRLKGEAIPLEARIVAVADVFDALTSERPYKKAWADEDALAFLQRESGRHFDPQLVALFVQQWPRIREVKTRWADVPVVSAESGKMV